MVHCFLYICRIRGVVRPLIINNWQRIVGLHVVRPRFLRSSLDLQIGCSTDQELRWCVTRCGRVNRGTHGLGSAAEMYAGRTYTPHNHSQSCHVPCARNCWLPHLWDPAIARYILFRHLSRMSESMWRRLELGSGSSQECCQGPICR